MNIKLGTGVHIGVRAEQAHACIEHLEEEYPDPVSRLIQLHYVKQVLDAELAKTQKAAMPGFLKVKEERGIQHDQFGLKVGGVLIEVDHGEKSFMYAKSDVYVRLMKMVKRLRREMRQAAMGVDNGRKPAVFRPGHEEVTMYFTGRKNDGQRAPEAEM